MAESLAGKVAVITGVASGFGKATAELFAKQDKVNLVLAVFGKRVGVEDAPRTTANGSDGDDGGR